VTDLEGIATELLEAYDSRITVAPLSGTYEGLTLDDAYEIQQIQVRRRIAVGASVIGYKVGLTSAAMQQQLGVYEPDYGHLLTDMLYPADAPIPVARFLQPRAEPEIALVLAHPLRTPGCSVTDIVSATAYAVPAIEIIDSRITDWRIGLYDTIADNASSAALVLGQTPRPIDRLDLSLAGCVLRRNGRIVQTGAGAAVLVGQHAHRAGCRVGRRQRHPDRIAHRGRFGRGGRRGDRDDRPPRRGHGGLRLTSSDRRDPLWTPLPPRSSGQAISAPT
jgi:2-keto-4-pentenoate hydratase